MGRKVVEQETILAELAVALHVRAWVEMTVKQEEYRFMMSPSM